MICVQLKGNEEIELYDESLGLVGACQAEAVLYCSTSSSVEFTPGDLFIFDCWFSDAPEAKFTIFLRPRLEIEVVSSRGGA